jgi:hypothetical protein
MLRVRLVAVEYSLAETITGLKEKAYDVDGTPLQNPRRSTHQQSLDLLCFGTRLWAVVHRSRRSASLAGTAARPGSRPGADVPIGQLPIWRCMWMWCVGDMKEVHARMCPRLK